MLNGSRVRRSTQASVMRLSARMVHTSSPGAWAAWAWSSCGGSLNTARGGLSSTVEPSLRMVSEGTLPTLQTVPKSSLCPEISLQREWRSG